MTKSKSVLTGQTGMPDYPVVRTSGWFEFLPAWAFYTSVVAQSIVLAAYYRSVTVPLLANPGIFLSGMVGEAKSDIFALAGDVAHQYIAPYVCWQKPEGVDSTSLSLLQHKLAQQAISFPLVAKPDKGCRGAGVQYIDSERKLHRYIEAFPTHRKIIFQALAPYPAEAGIFYLRYPGEATGEIISLGLKYLPSVIGDGVSTLKTLIEQHADIGTRAHLYHARHQHRLDTVIAKGERVTLAFSGSHCRGALFKQGAHYVTPELRAKMDEIANDIDGFYFGRFDIKFRDISSLMKGETLCIVEINGASSEPVHIWDSDSSYCEAVRALMSQYRHLYQIGAAWRRQGYTPPSLRVLLNAWREERQWMTRYPQTD
ncbi:D-alanine--D-alanine ligase [Salinivibrio proteolyticus]|uniref:D-alanine--D-alanine ligase n=1 Tax=Salinivibrio proteolyticus TaxID=334715 RepID=A0ABY7LJA6_9GAMM|nr:D-alanine--D-alanine ligase [Salinivibrio proteolyticus]WBA16526.1 D-alanine--D-alanine ligase [Salinivibrio proteolyticus]